MNGVAVEPDEPFVGPRPFEDDHRDHARFFGRDREALEVTSLILAQQTLLLYAASGAGKTSLLNAAVNPRLRAQGVTVLPAARVRDARAVDGGSVNPYAEALIRSAGLEIGPSGRLTESLAHYRRDHPDQSDRPTVLVIDQFEELFTVSTDDPLTDRRDLFEQLSEALEDDPRLRVVFSIREDFLANVDPYAPLLQGGLRARFRLRRLGPGAASAALVEPLEARGVAFGDGVAAQFVADLATTVVVDADGVRRSLQGEFVEPVHLQVVGQELWRELPAGTTTVTAAHLAAFGDIDRALSRHYERGVAAAATESGQTPLTIRRWVDAHLITELGTRDAVLRSGSDDNSGIIDALAHSHLVRGEHRAGAHWFELSHDRLIRPIRASNDQFEQRRSAAKAKVLRRWGAAAAVLLIGGGIALGFLLDRDSAIREESAATLTVRNPEVAFLQEPTQFELEVTLGAFTEPEVVVRFDERVLTVGPTVDPQLSCPQRAAPVADGVAELVCRLSSSDPGSNSARITVEMEPLAPAQGTPVSLILRDASDMALVVVEERTLDVRLDTASLVDGVTEVRFDSQIPGPIRALEPGVWWPIIELSDSDLGGGHDQVFMAARKFEKGRAIAVGHDGLLRDVDQAGEYQTADNARLAANAISWLGANAEGLQVGFLETGLFTWTNPGGASGFVADQEELGNSVSVVGELSAEALAEVDVLVIGNDWGFYDPDQYEALNDFVAGGKGLLVTGLGWSWYALVFNGNVIQNGYEVGVPVYTMNVVGLGLGVQWPDVLPDIPELTVASAPEGPIS